LLAQEIEEVVKRKIAADLAGGEEE
jgi:hypothetical protein